MLHGIRHFFNHAESITNRAYAWSDTRLHRLFSRPAGKAGRICGSLVLLVICQVPAVCWAAGATTGAEFQDFYTFIEGAATGFLGRAVAITGGLIALGIAAATGRYVVAIGGIILAIFGSLGPDIVNAIFGAVI